MNTQSSLAVIIGFLVLLASFILYLTADLDTTNAALHGALGLALVLALFRTPS